MRKLGLILIGLFFLTQNSLSKGGCDVSISFHPLSSAEAKASDKWLGWDKLEHLGVCAFLSGISYKVLRDFYYNNRESSMYLSAGLTFCAGLGKEYRDKKAPKGKFSYKDLIADVLGIGLGLWIATR